MSEELPGRSVMDLLHETLLLCKVPAEDIEEVMRKADRKTLERRIMLSDDDEGNGYHTMFYIFTDDRRFNASIIEDHLLHDRADWKPEDFIILG